MMNSPLQLSWRRPLPMILQVEVTECGLACLAMVATYHKLAIDVATLRRKFSVSLKGATLKGLIDIAKHLDFNTRPLKLDLDHVKELQTPCILHWDMNHFVVLKSVTRSGVIVHDPAFGVRQMSMEEFGKHFTGVALELTPSSDFKPSQQQQKFTLRSLMGRISGLGGALGQMFILAVALEVISLVAPFYMQWIVDHAIVSQDRDLVTVLGIGFILLVVLQSAISAFRGWVVTSLSVNLNFQWQGNVFRHLLKLPMDYFEKRHLGDLVSRFGSIAHIQKALTTNFVQAFVDGILTIGTLIVMSYYSLTLTAVAVVGVLLYIVLRMAVYKPLRHATAEQIVHAARQQTHFIETARGIQGIRLFGRTEERRQGWMNKLVDQFNAELNSQKIEIVYQTANTFLFGVERVIIIWMAALAVLDKSFSVGMLFAFIAYKDQFSRRMASLVDKIFELRMLRLHGERVADIVLTEAENEQAGMDLELADIAPSLEIQNVSYQYATAEPMVLNDFSLTIPAGQCIAIAGASGCGKTTLVKIILGLLNPTAGSIKVGDHELHHVGLTRYRSLVGSVMQDDTLFTGSIGDNISFFDPNPDQEKIQLCAQQASAHQDIMSMPMGYNTFVGESGTGLSGGQKQRVLLARALYKDPKILVLDEATSHLDIMSERAVNEAIKKMNLTRIIIAHRPETIGMADRVVVLHQGKVVKDQLIPQQPPAQPQPESPA